MRAHQIMTRSVITVTPETTIVEAANTMLQRHVSGLPVVKAGKLVGIVSEGDFIRRSEIGTERKRGRFLKFILGPGQEATDFVHEHGRKVAEIMTTSPLTITEDTPLEKIVELMEKNDIKRLPVTRGDQVVGIVSRANLLQAVASLARQVPDPTADDGENGENYQRAKHDPRGFVDAVPVVLFRVRDHDGVAAGVGVNGCSVIVKVGVFLKVLGTEESLEPEAEHIERRHAGGDETDEPEELVAGDEGLVKDLVLGEEG